MKNAFLILALAASSALAQFPNTATVTFTAPTLRSDGSPVEGAITYKLHQGLKGQPKTVVSTFLTTTTTVTTGLLAGREYCWQVSASEMVDSIAGPDSALSNEGCKRFQTSPPAPVTITVQ